MSNKRKGQLTVSGEWARHLRPLLRRAFWKRERQAAKGQVRRSEDGEDGLRSGDGHRSGQGRERG